MSKSELFEQLLSPSARALLKSIDRIERGESLDDLFQRDQSLGRIEQMISTYRGTLYNDICDSVLSLIGLGNIGIITQHDLMQIAEHVWYKNISSLSKTELRFLSAAFDIPGQSLKMQSTISRLSYSQTRRASKRLSKTNILRIRCALNCENLGLTRLLLVLESPDFVIAGPFVTSTIFVEGVAPKTYQVLKVPSRNLDDLVIKALRTSSHRATIWRLSSGNMAFNGLMYHRKSGNWQPDWIYWQLILRNSIGNILTMSSPSHGTIKAPHLSSSELKVIELLQENYELTANEIAAKTGISEATAFRIRRDIIDRNYMNPRSHLEIPRLQDRVIGLLNPSDAGEVYAAFDILPITYVAQCENIDNPSEKRALLMAALPSGSAPNLIRASKSEMSKISENPFEVVSGGYIERLPVSSLYDRKEKGWRMDANLIDARSYAIVRRESIGNRLPIDLA